MRATYRLQLTADFDFDAARATVPYLRRARDQPPLPLADHARPRGLDARLRRDRSDRVSEELGGEDGVPAPCAAAHEAGMGVIVDFVPNHMAASRREPVLARSAAPPHVLRRRAARGGWHRRFFTIDELAGVRVEDPEVFEETHRTILALVARGTRSTACGSTTSTVSRIPPATSSACASAACELVWVEKILERGEQLRDWPVQGTTGYEFANDVTALFIDPARRAAAQRPLRRADRLARDVRAGGGAGQARAGATTAFAPEIAKLRSLYDHPELERRGRLAAGLPHLRAARRRVHVERRPTASCSRTLPERAAPRADARGARSRGVRRALPADDRRR